MTDLTFYETSAQVIPLLLLAAGVETQWLQNLRPLEETVSRRKTRLEAVSLLVAALVVFAGELAALNVSLTGAPAELEKRLVILALLLGCFGVFTPILNSIIRATQPNLARYGDARVGRAAGMIAIRLVHATVALTGALTVFGWIG
jgi:hypothetical protein